MIRVGIAGLGFMGMIHYLAYQKVAGVEVTALATPEPERRAGDWTAIKGNFGPAGAKHDLAGVATYAEAEQMIREAEVDVIDICLPTFQHAPLAIAALEAGKNVLVEKAMALSVVEADHMLAAAGKADKILQVAHVLPFFPEWSFALEAIHSGSYGLLRTAHFRRHISPPNWSAAFADPSKTGGPVVDLHIHDSHFVVTACGEPSGIISRGVGQNGVAEYIATLYDFGTSGPTVSATCGAIAAATRPFTNGFEVYLEKATLFFESGAPLQVFTADNVDVPTLASSDPLDCFARELTAAAEGFRGGLVHPALRGETARAALALCLAEQKAACST